MNLRLISNFFFEFFKHVVDGYWTEWSPYGDCSVTCGEGYKYRTRECVGQQYGGKDCVGNHKEALYCKSDVYCPIDGYWSEYGKWSSCSKTCGKGIQTRSRICYEPKYGGKACHGSPNETRECKQKNKCVVKPSCTCKKYKLEKFTCLKWNKAEIERSFKGILLKFYTDYKSLELKNLQFPQHNTFI